MLGTILLIICCIVLPILIHQNTIKKYEKTSYYQITKKPYYIMKHDAGSYGEYLIYQYLQTLEQKGFKFLFNLYIPKENNETTEIDVLIICPKGIFVFESKNYSGWIYGSENQKNWTQVLPNGKTSTKIQFYNPITQNKTHIRCLKKLLKKDTQYHSIISFSDRCTLKKINLINNDVFVINRYDVSKIMAKICNNIKEPILSPEEIEEIYKKLYPYTQISEEDKQKHIENIKKYK